MILVVNKVDRPDARVDEVVDEVYELFLDLDADEIQIEFPIVYTQRPRRAGLARSRGREGTDLGPLLELLVEHIPAPDYEPGHPLQAHVTNLDASPYVGRLAMCRVRQGTIRARRDRSPGAAPTARSSAVKIAELYVTEALDRVDADGGRTGRDHRGRRDPGDHDRRDARRRG